MISDAQLPELKDFRYLEKKIPVERNELFAQLVVANGNDNLPVHRWFRFKESFSAKLLEQVLESVAPNLRGAVRLLDPFCGVGTVLLSAQQLCRSGLSFTSIGIERNPFIGFVAATKVGWPRIKPGSLATLSKRILEHDWKLKSEIPVLTSLSTGRCVTRYVSGKLLAIRDAIQENGTGPEHDALLLGLAACIEPLSKVRKDGRALRLVPSRRPRLIVPTLAEKWAEIREDCEALRKQKTSPQPSTVIIGDGRAPSQLGVDEDSVDLILTSPPYPNNIDYSEVYKLELWLLGFVETYEEFLELRKSTVRSHPTSELSGGAHPEFLSETKHGKLKLLFDPIFERTESSQEKWRHKLLLGYFSDMWSSLKEQYRCLKSNGRTVLVVGNSLHGGHHLPYLVPTDLALAMIAQRVGFLVDRVYIARNLMRRLSGNHFLRESVIILRKTNG